MPCPAHTYCRTCCLVVCLLLGAVPAHALDVRPLGDTSAPEFSGSDVPGYVPPMQWTVTDLLPAQEWERYARRPSAQLPLHPLYTPKGAYVPHGFAGSHAAVIPVSQAEYFAPRPSGPDPAALPVLSLKRGGGTKKSAPAPSMTSTSTTVHGQGVTPPTVVKPTVPTVSSPSVASPAAPTVPGALATPSVAPAPYASPASPTGPVVPSGPTAKSPTSPVAPGVAAPAAVSATATPTSPSTQALPAGQGTGNGAAGSVTGALQTNPNGTPSAGTSPGGLAAGPGEPPRQKVNILTGPAESLVIPPAGISLTPNNGSGALTSPQVSK